MRHEGLLKHKEHKDEPQRSQSLRYENPPYPPLKRGGDTRLRIYADLNCEVLYV